MYALGNSKSWLLNMSIQNKLIEIEMSKTDF